MERYLRRQTLEERLRLLSRTPFISSVSFWAFRGFQYLICRSFFIIRTVPIADIPANVANFLLYQRFLPLSIFRILFDSTLCELPLVGSCEACLQNHRPLGTILQFLLHTPIHILQLCYLAGALSSSEQTSNYSVTIVCLHNFWNNKRNFLIFSPNIVQKNGL